MGKGFSPERAEREANEIGSKFAHSSDVVKDMSRAYRVDFSNIRIHTDNYADSMVRAAGKDALAQGKDIFFGKGIFESREPAAKELVAHEFAHTMQQGVVGDAAVMESVPMGIAQGGRLRDWFRRLFHRKKKKVDRTDDYQTDEIKPFQNFLEDASIDTRWKKVYPKKGSEWRGHTGPFGQSIATGFQMPDKEDLNFLSEQSWNTYQFAANARPGELRNPAAIAAIMNDFQESMAERLLEYEDVSFETMYENIFEKGNAAEWYSYQKLLGALLPYNFAQSVATYGGVMMGGKNWMSNAQLEKGSRATLHEMTGMLLNFQKTRELGNPDGLMEVLQGGMDVFRNSPIFEGNEEKFSQLFMKSILTEHVLPKIAQQILFEKDKQANRHVGLRETESSKNYERNYMKAGKGLVLAYGGDSEEAKVFRNLLLKKRTN